jgi:undecaprenyl phosphate N,N'-diacetylbacillosamine 1-phosphate transferase
MRQFQLAIKRLMDIFLSLVVIFVAWPFLLVVALLVKLSSPGPAFFRQERVGLGQKPFRIIKFRTMVERGSQEPVTAWTAEEEARITPLGKLLRDYGLDELPQVLNILKGEMSIVGPRPPLSAQAGEYTEHQCKMFQMRPGVLSLAAVKGRRSIPMEKRIALHVKYVQEWSLGLDLKILWQALFVVLGRQDAAESVTE